MVKAKIPLKTVQDTENTKLSFTGERMIPELNKGMALYYEHLARYLFSAQIAHSKIILDIACGAGYGSFISAEYGKAKRVYGVDVSKEAIDYATAKYKHKEVLLAVDDAEELKSIKPNSIDISLAFEIIEHIPNPQKMLDHIKRVLKKQGLLIISTPNKYTYSSHNSFHIKEYYPEEFYQLLKEKFKNVKIYHQYFGITQMIKLEESIPNFKFEEELIKQKGISYTEPIQAKNSQYIIAICSDSDLPKLETSSINISKVDEFDFSKGLELCNLKVEIAKLKQSLELFNVITSSKFYKGWRLYCKARDYFFKR